MAEVLRARRPGDTTFWSFDKVVLAYFGCVAVLLAGWWNRIPGAPWLLAAHVAATALLIFEVKRPNPTSWVFRNWYTVFYVAACYREMAIFIPAIRRTNADQWLADLDFRLWGAHPSVWLERIYAPALTEYLQIVYTLFVPAVLWIAWLLWRRRDYAQFQYYAFLIALGYLVSYVGYLAVPARGPRFLLAQFQHAPLSGMWFFHGMQAALDRLEAAHYDCFPSGHTELTILAWWSSRNVSRPYFLLYSAYTPSIIFATVYLRYHYTIDLFAGMAVAAVLIATSPWMYRKLSQGA
ncbi:MAG TPA: phosphatase PAP2 family protein [Bryobacteraceae bacterium]